jgi:hypothetical protein
MLGEAIRELRTSLAFPAAADLADRSRISASRSSTSALDRFIGFA